MEEAIDMVIAIKGGSVSDMKAHTQSLGAPIAMMHDEKRKRSIGLDSKLILSLLK